MVDNKGNYYQTPIFESTDGTKYGINPFATDLPQTRTNAITENPEEKLADEENSLNCIHCDLTFVDNIEYEHHNVELHGKKKLFTCNVCNATFRRQDHLKRHQQSLHANQKYCTCPVCEKDCKRPDMLLKHIKKKHATSTEVFRCRECKYQCNTLQELEKHEYKHVIRDRQLCPHCPATFKRKDHMLRHVKSQHMNHFVVCPICGLSYKRQDHLVRHVREKHKMGLLNGKLVTASDIILE